MVVIDLPYKPRDYQQAFESAMFLGKKRALLVWHRRAGKDLACFNFLINEALKKVGVYHYVLPTHTQARKVIWDGITNDGKKYVDFIPSPIIHNKNNTEMKIWLKNGSLIQLLGSNNADSIAGTNPIGVVLSEYSLQDPTAMDLIYGPILAANHGWLVINGTARGKNHQYTLHRMAERNPNWFVSVLTIEDTDIISQERVEEERAEGKSEEIIQQEYYCSYQRGVEGAFYGRLMEKVYKDDRVTNVPYDPSVPVDTFWDLGYGDSTVVVFAQRVGKEIHIIDHYENHGEGLEHYVRHVKDKEYLYGVHYGPHDVDAGNLGIGMSIKSLALSLGLKFRTVPRARIEAGIEAVRSILPRCWFDKKNCTFLIQALENYSANYNATMGCYSNTPRHDRFSHSCFTGDVFVHTVRGRVPIKYVQIGDRVITPTGSKMVINKFSHKTSCLIDVKVGIFRVRCTPSHKIFSTKSLVYADALRYNDIVFILSPVVRICQKLFGFLLNTNGVGFRDYFLSLNMKNTSIVQKFLLLINTGKKKRVTEIATLNSTELQKVYDLEIEDDHCYYANGILVSNCDAMRYLASTYLSNASGTKLTPDDIKKMREKFQGAVGGI